MHQVVTSARVAQLFGRLGLEDLVLQRPSGHGFERRNFVPILRNVKVFGKSKAFLLTPWHAELGTVVGREASVGLGSSDSSGDSCAMLLRTGSSLCRISTAFNIALDFKFGHVQGRIKWITIADLLCFPNVVVCVGFIRRRSNDGKSVSGTARTCTGNHVKTPFQNLVLLGLR